MKLEKVFKRVDEKLEVGMCGFGKRSNVGFKKGW